MFPLQRDQAFLLLEWMAASMDGLDSWSSYIEATSRRTPATGEHMYGITTRREQDKQQYVEENAMENIQLRARQ